MSPRDHPEPLIKLMTSVITMIAGGISFSAYKGGNDNNVNFTGFYFSYWSFAGGNLPEAEASPYYRDADHRYPAWTVCAECAGFFHSFYLVGTSPDCADHYSAEGRAFPESCRPEKGRTPGCYDGMHSCHF